MTTTTIIILAIIATGAAVAAVLHWLYSPKVLADMEHEALLGNPERDYDFDAF